jgi:hypothetical protein
MTYAAAIKKARQRAACADEVIYVWQDEDHAYRTCMVHEVGVNVYEDEIIAAVHPGGTVEA